MRRRSAWWVLVTAAGVLCMPATAGAQFFTLANPNPLDPQDCSNNGCWTNYNLVVDLDGDGDLDVLLPSSAGFFNKGNPQPFSVYTNDGSGTLTKQAGLLGGDGYLRQVAVADIDGDDDLDLYAPSGFGEDPTYPDRLYVQGPAGTFTDEAATRLPGLQVRAGFVRFGDLDNDGDPDILVGDDWAGSTQVLAHLYLNDGTGKFTDATASNLPAGAPGGSDNPIDVDLFDADGDFDLDVLINVHQGKNVFWKNDGTGKFTDATAGFPAPGPGSQFHYGPVACDVDGDGDLDVWGDNTGGNYVEQLLINDGSGNFTDETAARVTGNPSSDDNGLTCVDADGDGDLDAAIMSLGSEERLLINDGTGHFTLDGNGFQAVGDPTLWFDFGDLNGDGRLDVVTAQGECGGNPQGCRDKVYFGTQSVPVDVFPPKIRGVEAIAVPGDNESPVLRFAVVDEVVTDVGPRLKRAFLRVTAGSMQEVDATFMGGDLFRAVVPGFPNGTMVSIEACAVDREDNEGCSMPLSYTVGGSSVSTGVGGSGGGAGGGGGPGGGGPGGAGNGGAGNSGTSGETGSASGGSSSGGGGGDDDGCGCGVPGAPARDGAFVVAALGMVAAIARRRLRRS